MSFLVALPRKSYPDGAIDGFDATGGLSIDSARAMMWLAQLAYDTPERTKVEDVLRAWQMPLQAFVSNDPATGLPLRSACVIVASGRGATVVAFAGTDPLKISDWITDFTPRLSAGNLHTGFGDALETVWPRIRDALARPGTLFFTGHSLGGALAIIAAERAKRELNVQATGVYTYGSPRPGGAAFFDAYGEDLANVTFRFVNGTDLVATVPPPLLSFRHVGRAIQCPTDGKFDLQAQMLSIKDDKPGFIESAFASGVADVITLAGFRLIRPVGQRLLGRLAGFLPRMVRDHIPENYFRRFSITLD